MAWGALGGLEAVGRRGEVGVERLVLVEALVVGLGVRTGSPRCQGWARSRLTLKASLGEMCIGMGRTLRRPPLRSLPHEQAAEVVEQLLACQWIVVGGSKVEEVVRLEELEQAYGTGYCRHRC